MNNGNNSISVILSLSDVTFACLQQFMYANKETRKNTKMEEGGSVGKHKKRKEKKCLSVSSNS